MSKRKTVSIGTIIVVWMAIFSSCTTAPRPALPTQTSIQTITMQVTQTVVPKVLPTESELIALMQRMVETERRASGMVIGMIAPNEKIIVGYGKLNETDGQVPRAKSLFEIGSISKVFIGTLLAESVRRGEVKLDDPASKYLPASVKMLDYKGTPITLIDLATHTSALPRELEVSPEIRLTPENWIQAMYGFLSNYELTYAPGTNFGYSNLGMTLLAHILELRTGLSYDVLLKERILQPLGMNDTYLLKPNEMPPDRLSTGHTIVLYPQHPDAYIYNEPERRYVGGILASAEDMLTFASAAMGLEESSLLPAFQEATKPLRPWGNNKAGLAWGITEGEFPFIHHSGDTHGMHSFLGFDPQRQVAVVVLMNAANPKDDIGPHLLHPGRYSLETYSPRILPTPKLLDTKVLETYTGQYELVLDGEIVATFIIKAEGQRLVVYKDGERDFSMIAETETRFVAVELEAWVTFIIKEGVVTSLVIDQPTASGDYTFKKVEP